jgi:site-specific DNA-methyltransferase (adenine-specific)
MKRNAHEPPRERKTSVIHFRVPSSVAASLAAEIDPAAGVKSVGDVARALALQALAERERHRQLSAFDASNLKSHEIFEGDAVRILSALPAKAFRTCVTSPPYWRQRNYGNHPDQMGQESTPEQYINRLADVFEQVQRVLANDGTLWLNIGESYRHKELVGVPWRLAFELQRRGWRWRAEIVWAKVGKPEPVKDRPTRSHEAVLLFSKQRRYFYDYRAILEPHGEWAVDCIRKAQASGFNGRPRTPLFNKEQRYERGMRGVSRAEFGALMNPDGKNKRDVWAIPVEKFRGAHSAVMPVALADICIRAGSRAGDVVLDPFCGTGTTGAAAIRLGRKFVGIDLLKKFVEEARHRLREVTVSGTG